MAQEDSIKFLGTAGARFAVARQLRASGGTWLQIGGRRIMLDPGPGALVRAARSRPRLDVTVLVAVILTHAHIDHSNDVNAVLDAMTAGGFEPRGELFAPAQCLEGPDRILLDYLRPFVERIVTLEPEGEYETGGVRFAASVRHLHGCETYGVKFHRERGDLSFLVDTGWFDGLPEAYAPSDVLVVNVVRHRDTAGGRIQHLTIDDAERVFARVRPRIGVITHFGMTMLKAKPRLVADEMSERLGLRILAAGDGMTLKLDEG